MTPLSRPIIETVGLEKHFHLPAGPFRPAATLRAVDGIDLAVREGETLALVGESGCGKSTLGRMLVGLLDPSGGDVVYRGRNLAAFTRPELRSLRRELQIIFQDPFSSLNPRMLVSDIVGEPLWLHEGLGRRARGERVAELLSLVGLSPEHGERYPHEFSGGQRQRIGIARALACGPKVIVGDEPVSALDISVQAQIVNLLEDLKERLGLTLIVVAHGLGVIRHMSDRVAVMYLGEIVEMAETDALFDSPLHPYSRALLAANPRAVAGDRRPRRLLEGEVPSPTAPPSGCRFHTRCPHAQAICAESRPRLAPAGTAPRQVACHFWAEIAEGEVAHLPSPVRPPALTRRLALFSESSNAHLRHEE
ncbi:ABC transporter ATP-binding protein [Telmatospirillum siberiense]|uniref:Oligopeptide ABC transporter ATP-binding protein n=1 Tax=Telmatospirillum siberiense TaxID=382514 RepID=A0A2N3PN46_9PROT|nr:oligopeptide/dipeptide ABC transporter ATP-binding protein [Telmatospirillum siberiense]PKU21810.1 oligopeptide ABC transporter ATP-binding protein [Telmatospirillum siberiense]